MSNPTKHIATARWHCLDCPVEHKQARHPAFLLYSVVEHVEETGHRVTLRLEPEEQQGRKLSPEEVAEAIRISDLLHPNGRCTCHGEGTCETFCRKVCPECLGDCMEQPCAACNSTGWRK